MRSVYLWCSPRKHHVKTRSTSTTLPVEVRLESMQARCSISTRLDRAYFAIPPWWREFPDSDPAGPRLRIISSDRGVSRSRELLLIGSCDNSKAAARVHPLKTVGDKRRSQRDRSPIRSSSDRECALSLPLFPPLRSPRRLSLNT